MLKISQHKKDIEILLGLKDFFGIGKIYIDKKLASLCIMDYKNLLNIVIPHFENYPLITQKRADYNQWKKIILLMETGEHLTEEGIKICLTYKANQNKGLNETQKILYPKINKAPKVKIKCPEIINPNWLSGFTSREGSFMIRISKNNTLNTGYRVIPYFEIGQEIIENDIDQLKKIKYFQGCGIIYRDNTKGRIVITKLKDIRNIIIPQFKEYPLINRKKLEFIIWCEIITMMENKEHLTDIGLIKIRYLRNKLRQVNNLDIQSKDI